MELKIIVQRYLSASFVEETRLLKITWFPESEYGTIKEFIELNEKMLSGLTVERVFSDLRDFKFTIVPNYQADLANLADESFIR
ncbi:MAG: hypothetical protein SFU27_07320, partial [Thermonemataceae bacterium]|nr:hypothetical protein [Thermonemataceae bacterium]